MRRAVGLLLFLAACGREPAAAPPPSSEASVSAPSVPPEPTRLLSAELEWRGEADLDLEVWSDSGYIREAVSDSDDVKTGGGGKERLRFDGDVGAGDVLLGVGWYGDGRAETAAARLTVVRSDSTAQVLSGELDRENARFWMAARVRPDRAEITPVDQYYYRRTSAERGTASR